MSAMLDFEIVSYEGGEYSEFYGVQNILYEGGVYCSSSGRNVNVVLRLTGSDNPPPEFTLTEASLYAPSGGFTAPVCTAALWILPSLPDSYEYDKFNTLTQSEFEKLDPKDPLNPCIFWNLKTNFHQTIKIPHIRGRYLFIKFISSRPGSNGTNIDVERVVFAGYVQDKSKPFLLEPLDYKSTKYSNVVIKSGSKKIQSQKIMWTQCRLVDLSGSEVDIGEIKPELFDIIHKYLFTGLAEINQSNHLYLIGCCEKLGLDSLKASCLGFIFKTQCTEDNVCNLIMDCKQGKFGNFDVRVIMNKSQRYLMNHADQVLESKDFVKLDPEIIISLLKSEKISCDEVSLFKGLVRWCEANLVENSIVKTITPFIDLIRFGLISAEDLILIVKPTGLCPFPTYLKAIEYNMAPDMVDPKGLLYKERQGITKFVLDNKTTGNSSLFQVSNKGLTWKKIGGGNTWANAMIYGSVELKRGIHYFEYKVDSINSDHSGFAVGVTENPLTKGTYSQDMVIGMSGYQYRLQGTNSTKVQPLDVIGVHLDFSKLTLHFFLNGTQIKTCHGKLKPNQSYWACIHLYYVSDQVTLNFPTKKLTPQ